MILVGNTKGFKDSELEKLQKAVDLANAVMQSDLFKAHALAVGYSCTGNSSTLIFNSIVPQKWTVNFSIETPPFWKRWTKEIAREVTGVGIVFNRLKFKDQSVASLAGTAAHEVSHTAGYSHPFWPSKLRDTSVPYQIGQIVEGIAKGDLN